MTKKELIQALEFLDDNEPIYTSSYEDGTYYYDAEKVIVVDGKAVIASNEA